MCSKNINVFKTELNQSSPMKKKAYQNKKKYFLVLLNILLGIKIDNTCRIEKVWTF